MHCLPASQAACCGLRVLRALSRGPLTGLLLSGVYNEEIWESLDFVLAEAAKRDLRLIIPIEVSPCSIIAQLALHAVTAQNAGGPVCEEPLLTSRPAEADGTHLQADGTPACRTTGCPSTGM